MSNILRVECELVLSASVVSNT